tara:strand:- start:2390 stop:2842 length:453 start_codon:yes stop_codon:yes gene_type:complete
MTTFNIDNTVRAYVAHHILTIHSRINNAESESLDHQVVDLMTDLIHLCLDEGLAVSDCIERSLQQVESESGSVAQHEIQTTSLRQINDSVGTDLKGFLVSWVIDIDDADTAIDAARQARSMQSPGTSAVYFDVIEKDTLQRTSVDLLDHV